MVEKSYMNMCFHHNIHVQDYNKLGFMMPIFACCFFINNVLDSIKIVYNVSLLYS